MDIQKWITLPNVKKTDSFGTSKASFDMDDNHVNVNGFPVCKVMAFDLHGMDRKDAENGKLIASTFTAGTLVEDLGFDMIKTLDNLPEMLLILKNMQSTLNDKSREEALKSFLENIKLP